MTGKIVGFAPNQKYFLDGKQVAKAEFDLAFPPQPMCAGGQCSLSAVPETESVALACHPRRAKEFEEDATKRGVPTTFLPNGSPIIRSRKHQAAYLKAYFGNTIVNRDEIS